MKSLSASRLTQVHHYCLHRRVHSFLRYGLLQHQGDVQISLEYHGPLNKNELHFQAVLHDDQLHASVSGYHGCFHSVEIHLHAHLDDK